MRRNFVGEIQSQVKVFRIPVAGKHEYIHVRHRQTYMLSRRSKHLVYLHVETAVSVTGAVLHRHAVAGDRNVILFKSDRTNIEIFY